MPGVMTMHKPQHSRLHVSVQAKVAATFEKNNSRLIRTAVKALKEYKAEELEQHLRALHELARAVKGLEHFTIRQAELTPGQEQLLRNSWLRVNGVRGSHKITMHIG